MNFTINTHFDVQRPVLVYIFYRIVEHFKIHSFLLTYETCNIRFFTVKHTSKSKVTSTCCTIWLTQLKRNRFVLGSTTTERQKRHLYEIRLSENGQEIECITCELKMENCNFVDTNFEPNVNQFYELQCLGPSIPTVYIMRTTHHTEITTLRQIDEYKREVLQRLTPGIQYMDVKLTDGSIGRVQILLPLSWQNSVYNKLNFPLIVQT